MTLKVYLSGVIFATALAAVAFLSLLGLFSPNEADAPLIILAFFSLFTALAGIFSLAGFFIRRRRWPNFAPFRFLAISFRQGALLSFLATGLLYLRAFDVIWPLSGVFLLLIVFAAEYFFLKRI